VETVADLNLPITKFQFLTETYSLRSLFPVEFAGLLSTGQMDFTLSLYEMSKRRPGVYRQRIKRVDIELQFPPPSGFTGRIRHSGSFLLRDRDTALQAQTFMPTVGELQAALDALGAGASQGIPIGGVIPFVLDVDTIELSPNPTPPALSDPDPDALMPIEGYGPAGDWRLEIENVDLRFISDALMHVTYVIPESDQPLATKVKSLLAAYETGVLLPGDARDLISTFALRTRFPAALGQLASGSALLTFAAHDFPAGITGRRLKTVVVQALDASRAGVSGVVVELTKPGTAFAVQRTTSADGFTESLAGAVPVLDSADRPDVDGDYELRVPDPAQLSRIDDLLLLFVYEFREVT
jgi:hypothetical protein